jgi:hypothetical protein
VGMGDGRACGGALGGPAVNGLCIAMVGTIPLLGCSLVSGAAGVVAGGTTAAATGNPVVGYAVGLGVRAGAEEIGKYVTRVRKDGEQDAIADAAGRAPVGETRRWEIRHTIPIGNTRGTLVVVDEIPNVLAFCRDVLFTPDDDTSHFATPICFNHNQWHWAAAEPAVDRWGALQ